MYGKDFFERLDVRRLCAYLQEGESIPLRGGGSLEERSKALQTHWYQALEDYRDMVLKTEWEEEQKAFVTEDLCEPLEMLRWELEYLSFEAGFRAAFALIRTFYVS